MDHLATSSTSCRPLVQHRRPLVGHLLQGVCSSSLTGLLLCGSTKHPDQSDQEQRLFFTEPTLHHHGLPQRVHVAQLWSGKRLTN